MCFFFFSSFSSSIFSPVLYITGGNKYSGTSAAASAAAAYTAVAARECRRRHGYDGSESAIDAARNPFSALPVVGAAATRPMRMRSVALFACALRHRHLVPPDPLSREPHARTHTHARRPWKFDRVYRVIHNSTAVRILFYTYARRLISNLMFSILLLYVCYAKSFDVVIIYLQHFRNFTRFLYTCHKYVANFQFQNSKPRY